MDKRRMEAQINKREGLFRRVFSGVLVMVVVLGAVFFSSVAARRTQRAKPAAVTTAQTEKKTEKATSKAEKTTAKATDADAAQPSETQEGETTTEKKKETTTAFKEPKDHLIYLTFDDGPCANTERLLNILDKYDVKVTFFVTNVASKYQDMIKREAKSGHSVGVHSYTHNYEKIYASETAFWDDFNKMQDVIKAQTGKKTKLMRFPGGSSNTVSKITPGIMTRLTKQMTDKGIAYFDWNVMSGDAGLTTSSDVVLKNCKDGVSKFAKTVLLCHDTKDYTVNAMEAFIKWALDNGYTFMPLNEKSFSAHHGVNN